MKFLTYNPEQAYLLPPSVREVLGEDPICFFVHQGLCCNFGRRRLVT